MSWWGTVIAQLHLSPQKRGRTIEISWEDLERLELGGLCAVSTLRLMTASRENKGDLSHQRLNLHKPHWPGVWEGPYHGYEHLCFPQSISAEPGILDPKSQGKCSPSIQASSSHCLWLDWFLPSGLPESFPCYCKRRACGEDLRWIIVSWAWTT